MGCLPTITPRKLVPILQRMGFVVIRQRGSHMRLTHAFDRNRKITIPIHNRDLSQTTLIAILKQANISKQDLINLL